MIIVGDFASLVSFFGFSAWLFYLLTVLGLLILRSREPNLPRSAKPTAFDSPVLKSRAEQTLQDVDCHSDHFLLCSAILAVHAHILSAVRSARCFRCALSLSLDQTQCLTATFSLRLHRGRLSVLPHHATPPPTPAARWL